MTEIVSNDMELKNKLINKGIYEKSIVFKTSLVDGLLNKTQSTNSKINDFTIFKSINSKVEILNNKIKLLAEKLTFYKCQEISKSIDNKHSSESQRYLNSFKEYIIDDEDTESSSDDSYSNIDSHGTDSEAIRILNKYQAWLIERCQFQAKWSWLLSEIQSTEFRLKHLKKYSEEIKHLKRRYCFKNDLSLDDNSRNKYSRLEKRKRVQTHNLLSADLIKFVSPLYSNDDNSSDKFVQCKCRLGDVGPCILCCGMKNKISQGHIDFFDKEDIWKASILDNCIHIKLSNINDVRNQVKRNVLFNGYVKSNVYHWSSPRVRTSLFPVLSAPSQPSVDLISKVEPIVLGFNEFNLDKIEYNFDASVDNYKIENDNIMRSIDVKVEIKLPQWKKAEESKKLDSFQCSKMNNDKNNLLEDLNDDTFIKRHEYEEILERQRNYPLTKVSNIQIDYPEKPQYFHGYEYVQNTEHSYELRIFPLFSDEFKQLSQSSKTNFHRSKRFKKKLNKF